MFIESMNQPITNWLNLNYVACKDSSIPRCIIYQHYCEDFKEKGIEPLNTAMFGKVIKLTFPFIRSRRLGNRGNSKYHYFGVAEKGTLASTMEKETLTERLFIQKYAELHKYVYTNFSEGKYMKGYQEMKLFWTENMSNFVPSRNVERLCNIIEREFFGLILSKAITTDSILDLDREITPENVVFIKTTAKTIILMCRQIFPMTCTKGIVARSECYKEYASVLNGMGNIQKYFNILQEKYSKRAELSQAKIFLGTGLCIVHKYISLERSSLIHSCAVSLLSLFISSNTFQDFLSDVDSHVTTLLYRKEKIHQDLVSLYFSGIVQECISSGIARIDILLPLFNFFTEHFSIVNSTLCELSLKKKESSSPLPTAELTSEERSFVSKIIKQC